jgi:hypothetical protein
VLADVGERGMDVDTGFIGKGRRMILHRNNGGPGFMEHAGSDTADIAKALNDDTRALDRHMATAAGFTGGDEDTAPGRFVPAERAAQRNRLAGDDAGRRRAGIHRVGVHHPGHRLLVGADVGRRNILVRPDDDADFRGVAPGDALQLVL